MRKFKSDLQKEASKYVSALFTEKLSKEVVYHNLQHTLEVVDAAITIGKKENINEADMEIVVLAALFHDTGHTMLHEGHEEVSQQIAEDFLLAQQVDSQVINQVKELIGATRMPQKPTSLLAEILCDADLYHLSSTDFVQKADLLRQEWHNLEQQTHTDEAWVKQNVDFLKKHQYFTPYGKETLELGKEKNIKQQKKALKKLKDKIDASFMRELNVDEEELKEIKKKLQKVKGRSDRGVETMFRTTSRNHLDLSSMADSKANIMISVNAIIISIVVGSLASKLDTNPHLIIPTAILLLVCLVATVFSVLATRPNVTSGTFTKEDINNKKANLLFFGNFHSMKLEDFEWGMNQLINDSDYLYGSMIRDIYFLGAVLGKKYHLLRTAYTVFMYGLTVAVLAFIVAGLMPPEEINYK